MKILNISERNKAEFDIIFHSRWTGFSGIKMRKATHLEQINQTLFKKDIVLHYFGISLLHLIN